MTGNTKVWRAPLAGLASLAMLATMGVAATTANAAPHFAGDDVTVSVFGNRVSVPEGTSYADLIAAHKLAGVYNDNLNATASATESPESKEFAGYDITGNAALTDVARNGAEIKVKSQNAGTGVRVHFVTTTDGGTVYDLGWVRTSAVQADNKGDKLTVSLDKNQMPYDYADGIKLVYGNATGAGVTGTLSADGGTLTVEAGQLQYPVKDKDGKVLAGVATVNIPSVKAYKLTFTTGKGAPTIDPIAAGSAAKPDVVTFPGATADADTTVASALTVEVPEQGTFDPQTVIDNTYIKDSDPLTSLDHFNVFGSAATFTKDTNVTSDTKLSPFYVNAFHVRFYNGDTLLSDQIVAQGKTPSEVAVPGRDDSTSTATKWSTDKDGKVSATPFTTPVYKDMDYYTAWVDGGAHYITYKFNDGTTADSKVTVKANQKAARPEDPKRDGYIFGGWYVDANGNGALDASESEFTFFGSTLPQDYTLIAKWLKADKATLEAAFDYVDGGDVKFNDSKYQGLFTDASFKEYVATYQAVQAKYADARTAADAKNEEIPADTYNSLLSELVAGWKKLEFIHTGDSNSFNIVHRLSKGNDHFYTQDAGELKYMTNKNYSGSWNDEGELFQAVPKAEKFKPVYAGLQSFDRVAGTNNDIKVTLDSIADPILTNVTRLYNRVNGDHVWTVDQNEVDFLSAQAAWNNESTAFFVPRYTGSQPVTRLAKGARHLLSTDANEVKVLTADGWGNEGVAFKAY